jgi:hypothetical protein
VATKDPFSINLPRAWQPRALCWTVGGTRATSAQQRQRRRTDHRRDVMRNRAPQVIELPAKVVEYAER